MISSTSMKNTVHLTFKEEAANAISHGSMMFLMLFLLPFLAVRAYLQGGWLETAGISVYLWCMICMFGGSCLYHIMPYDTQWKYVFRKLDHIAILLAIAGTYTPICLCLVHNWVGWLVLAVEWCMVIAGVLLKSLSDKTHPVLSMTIYMTMGWLAILILPMLIHDACWQFIILIVLGGIFYTIGAFFFCRKKPYDHFIWHIFIILASLSHLAAIVFYMHP